MNLRLDPALESALRDASAHSGQSQQEITRAAITAYLPRVGSAIRPADPYSDLVASATVRAPRRPYSAPDERINLPDGVTTLDLLDRDDRLE